ncbi:MAG: hydroxymethylbilane synthase [Corynebacteriales bacterium]|nr:hydroxymethylbilane synthase [Mycobacteriales bacterium]
MSNPALRLGTRGSKLALAQSTHVADALRDKGHTVELVIIKTLGDISSAPITELGGVGVFTSALREALIAGDIDLAVHSYKDLPTAAHPKLVLAATPEREDPRDALVARDGHTLASLPAGALVGTGAPRRLAQIAARRPDLKTLPIRGNVDSRIQRVLDGELDAVVLAYAGLRRLGLEQHVTEILNTDVMLPAPAQGALAIETRPEHAELIAVLDHAPTRAQVNAERALLSTLEAGCSAPVAGYAEICDVFGEAHLHLYAGVFAADGHNAIRRTYTSPPEQATALGTRTATALLAANANALMRATHQTMPPASEHHEGEDK